MLTQRKKNKLMQKKKHDERASRAHSHLRQGWLEKLRHENVSREIACHVVDCARATVSLAILHLIATPGSKEYSRVSH